MANGTSAETMFLHAVENLLGDYTAGFDGPLFQLVYIFTKLASLVVFTMFLFRMKDMSTPNSQVRALDLFLLFMAGSFLWNIAGVFQMGTETLYNDAGSYLAYDQSQIKNSVNKDMEKVVRYFLFTFQFVGLLALVRAVLVLVDVANARHKVGGFQQPPSLARSAVFAVSGILLININATLDMVMSTLNIGT